MALVFSARRSRSSTRKNVLQAVEAGTRLASLLVDTPSPGGKPSARFRDFADRIASRDRGRWTPAPSCAVAAAVRRPGAFWSEAFERCRSASDV